MSPHEVEPPPTRRRADARRNIAAILDAAVALLEERPDATMAEIAEAAGVTRQTVYAHFESREALLSAVLDRAFDASLAAIDAARLDEGPAGEALERLVQAGWGTVEIYTGIMSTVQGAITPDELDARHEDVMARLVRLIRRGQRAGEFDREVPASWHVATVIGLIHVAARSAETGQMSSKRAIALARRTIRRAVAPA